MHAVLPNPVTAPPQVMTLPAPSPADLLKGLPASYRDALLSELLSQKVQADGECSIFPLTTATGQELGLFFRTDPTAWAADAMYAQLDPVTRANVMKPFLEFDWDNCASDADVASPAGR